MKWQYRITYIDSSFLLKTTLNNILEVLTSYGNNERELASCFGAGDDKRIIFIFKKPVQ